MTENTTSQPIGGTGQVRPAPAVSKLASAAMVCLLVSLAVCIVLVFMEAMLAPHVSGMIFAVPFAASAVLGIAALISIALSGNSLVGMKRATAAIVTSTGMLFLAAIGIGGANIAHSLLCLENMKGVSNSLLVYGMDNRDQLPDMNRWCDLLVAEADISPSSFKCRPSHAHFGEASYALNRAIAGMKLDELPKDIVVAFEMRPPERLDRSFPVSSRRFATDPNTSGYYGTGQRMKGLVDEKRWNLVGGPEDVDAEIHIGGCNIMFGDHHVEFVRKHKLPSLRWNLDGQPLPPETWARYREPDPQATYAVLSGMAGLMLFCAILLLVRCRRRRWGLIATMAILSGAAGYFCGLISGPIHTVDITVLPWLDRGLAGAICGVWAGICYGLLAGSAAGTIRDNRAARQYTVALGMASGIAASTVFHSAMMVALREAQGGLPIIAGLPFGILAGAILGGIACAFIPVADKPIAETTHA